ncbi:ribonuclease HII [Candidatus Pacearchaeota archaeon]|nr:ribonuclease HII [Candidatus Pacearchaeota archaeon]
MLILGIDDAGRGPLIGPMILAGVLINKEQEKYLKKSGITDSKLLLHEKRISLSELIKKHLISSYTVSTTAEQIDLSINSGINLNTLEAMKAAEIINNLNKGKEKIKVIVDCPSVNTIAWKNTLSGYIEKKENLEIHCEHKADFNHTSVSAASILAKVRREEEISKLRDKYKEFGNIGSGYPSDPITKEFLRKSGLSLKDSGIFRKTWSTWKSLFPEQGQKTLEEY